MTQQELRTVLQQWDKHGEWLFTINELALMFPNETRSQLRLSLHRHVETGALIRISKGVYANGDARSRPFYVLEAIAQKLRAYEMNYISLESALSEYGRISQVPIGLLTLMTTGRSGFFLTPWGNIEFIHTKRTPPAILSATFFSQERNILFATEETALRDLKAVGRNLDLVEIRQEKI
ncbi:type IV toxin-antitoxin system AbiEi family antitoxin [Brenneria corticis]|uniref:Transcriptional regulator n=1 Tax=Brenneria corticis TaxID=2173106 RepID=A0A2U1TVJ0_9GAMM|nr:hypothetical protein [Brenneria sp. CFCC 11842]PWC13418.1 hypothetical protein DDT56_15315 [Brenneria sp. CFCC 11842]